MATCIDSSYLCSADVRTLTTGRDRDGRVILRSEVVQAQGSPHGGLHEVAN